uniref:Tetratricopeptide repeat-containing protein n=1 Tax=Candidatus Kentrum sp. FM TaxID=2126340 RepID=A0A450SB02_9GAMM|nr:MAG: hypothetical protein BECKFM1743A_GA0114220_100631 [Candidatus Kentron sp. FM]VFJ49287.1 MAG: hypothetical protein BECKFM1743C_GA0114222_100691 [Candidatus Kentron sp. FM]VFK08466.1 MAG: hypothetical protein BECKFM1743B_GA0114221_100711 [Candidatus Kentron sp. FM]
MTDHPPHPSQFSEAAPLPATGDNGADNAAESLTLIWVILGVSFAATAATYPINDVISAIFLALSVAVGSFGLFRKIGWLHKKWDNIAETLAIAVAVLSGIALLIWWKWDWFSVPEPTAGPPPVDIHGMVYVGERPATGGEIRILGTRALDNRRPLTDANPGYFRFQAVPGIRDTVLFSIDVDRPLDTKEVFKEYPVSPGHPIEIHIDAPPPPEPTPGTPHQTTVEIDFRGASGPLPPYFHAAPEALAGRFVGREREFAELDAAWAGVLSGEGADPNQPPVRVVGIIAWGGFGKSALARQWLWRRFEGGIAALRSAALQGGSSRSAALQGGSSRSAALQGGSSFPESAARQGGGNETEIKSHPGERRSGEGFEIKSHPGEWRSGEGFEIKSRPGERRSEERRSTALFWWGFQEGQGADNFAIALIRYLADDPALTLAGIPSDTAGRLALLRKGLEGREYLLVLDGLEGEQDPARGDALGRLNSAFLRGLLREQAAGRLGRGLVVAASRLALADLDPRGGYLPMDLEDRPLSREEAGWLLKIEGVEDLPAPELTALLATIGPHPLALETMAGFLVRHNGASAAGWQRFQGDVLEPTAGREQERQLWRVLAWSAQLLRPDEARVATAIARFREPARQEWLLHLLAPEDAPAVARETTETRLKQRLEQAGLDSAAIKLFLQQFREQSEEEKAETKKLLGNYGAAPVYSPEELALPGGPMTGRQVRDALDGLAGLRLLRREGDGGYAMHDLVREYFRRADDAHAVAAHLRLYRLYSSVIQPVWRPDGLEALRPLYEAVWHGARAGLHQEAAADVYRDRILRGTGPGGNYSTKKLGAVEADLGAVRNLFAEPWGRPAPGLAPGAQAWLLNQAATRLRALGRLGEAVEPMGAGLEIYIEQESWRPAAITASNLSELELTLGRVAAAVESAERAVEFADRVVDQGRAWEMRMITRTTLADGLHQAGERERALPLFQAAEAIQAKDQPHYPRLYSVQGFRYAELLLAGAEGGAWRAALSRAALKTSALPPAPASSSVEVTSRPYPPRDASPLDPSALLAACDEAADRATGAQRAWREIFSNDPSILDIALDRLTLARAGLYRALLAPPAGAQRPAAPLPEIERHLTAAVDGLRKAGDVEFVVRGLLTQAWYLAVTGERAGARAALEEAWGIAEAGPMPLFQADILLTRARLFGRKNGAGEGRAQYPWGSARADLEGARRLIEEHGYHRRAGELEDAQAMTR